MGNNIPHGNTGLQTPIMTKVTQNNTGIYHKRNSTNQKVQQDKPQFMMEKFQNNDSRAQDTLRIKIYFPELLSDKLQINV